MHDIRLTGAWEGPDALRRLLSCMLILSLPEEGAVEALNSIEGIWDFYTWHPSLPLAPADSFVVKGRSLAPSMRPLLELPE